MNENIFVENFKICIRSRGQAQFIDTVVNTLIQYEKGYQSIAFTRCFYKYPSLRFDLKLAIETLLNANRNSDIVSIINTNIYFIFNMNRGLTDGPYMQYYSDLHHTVYKRMRREYFEIPEKKEQCDAMCRFQLFDDVVVAHESVEKYIHGRTELYNVNEWLNYCRKIIEHFFPLFEFDRAYSKKGYVCFTKNVCDSVKMGIQYRESWLKTDLKRGTLKEPTLNLIIILNEKSDRSHTDDVPAILDLGTAENPFFKSPVATPEILFATYSMKKISDSEYEKIPTLKTQEIDTTNTRIFHECSYEYDLKSQLFYYFDLMSFFSKSYFSFIEECVKEAVNMP